MSTDGDSTLITQTETTEAVNDRRLGGFLVKVVQGCWNWF